MKFYRCCRSTIYRLVIVSFLFIHSGAQAAIKVGTVLFKPPFEISMSKGQESGFDIDLMQALCQGLGEQCTYISLRYDKLLNAVLNGDVDLAVGGITISVNRKKQYLFSLPYMLSKAQFLILTNGTIKSMDDLQGQKVGVVSDEIFAEYLHNKYPNQFQVTTYPYALDMIQALSNGDIAAVYFDQPTVNYWIQHGGGEFKALGSAETIGYGYGIMAMASNILLIERINQQLLILEQNGVYLNLYNKYFGDMVTSLK